MASIECSTVIARPLRHVFESVLDLENSVEFDPGIRRVTKRTPGAIGPGTEFDLVQRLPPRGRFGAATVRYTRVEPPRQIAFVGQLGLLAPTGELQLEECGGGTRVTFRGDPNPVGILRPLAFLAARQGRRAWKRRLQYLKVWLEQGRSSQSPGAP